jgi:hypothetical protein
MKEGKGEGRGRQGAGGRDNAGRRQTNSSRQRLQGDRPERDRSKQIDRGGDR